jgi:hypothetical protein
VTFWINGSNVSSSGASTVTFNGWSHVAISRSGTTLKLFINGVEVDSDTNSTNIVPTAALTIGADITSSAYEFQGYISNVRVVKGTALYTGAFTPPAAPLTAVSGTSLLTCQSNRFVDNSSNAFAITRNGGTKVTPFSPFAPTAAYSASVNGGSGYFDGTGDALEWDADSSLAFGTGDFCCELYFYTPDKTRIVGTASQTMISLSGTEVRFFLDSGDGELGFTYGGSAILTGHIVNENEWTHVVLCRSGTDLAAFANGVRVYSATDSTNITNSTTNRIGARTGTTGNWLGYISGVRAVSGDSVYDPTSTTLTVPTAPLTDISNTQLLCNFTNAGIFDNTGKNNLETVGNAQVDTTTKKYGTGSMEFDGTGDALVIPASTELAPLTGDFTYEAWVNPSTTNTTFRTVFGIDNYGSGQPFRLYQYGTVFRAYVVGNGSSDYIQSSTITSGTFYHLAITRSGTTITFWLDGVSQGTKTSSTSFPSSIFRVGLDSAGTYPFSGFVDDLRITKGVARYLTSFTPPTKAFPDQ